MLPAGNVSLTITADRCNAATDLHAFETPTADFAALHRELSMQSVRAMREEVGTASASSGASWSRIVFIALVCALGGVGFLAATVLMNGRTPSFVQPPAAAPVDVQKPASDQAGELAPKGATKPKREVNGRFQLVDVVPRAEINRAALARCRSHLEAGRAFDGLSPKRVAEIRAQGKAGERDSASICADYLAAENSASR